MPSRPKRAARRPAPLTRRNPSGSRILGQEDRWMSRKTKKPKCRRDQKPRPKPSAADAAQSFRLTNPRSGGPMDEQNTPPTFRLSNPRSGRPMDEQTTEMPSRPKRTSRSPAPLTRRNPSGSRIPRSGRPMDEPNKQTTNNRNAVATQKSRPKPSAANAAQSFRLSNPRSGRPMDEQTWCREEDSNLHGLPR